MMTIRKSLALAAALALVAPQAQAQDAKPHAAPALARLSDAEASRRVDAVIAQALSRPEAAGLSVAVARGDRIIYERGAGWADAENKRHADAATEFRIGSLTKQFTAAAIMKLVERGKLGLDDPLAKYLPEFDTGGRTVTIRQMLNHASGIPNYTAQPGFRAISDKPDLTPQDVLGLLKGVRFDFEPGKGWAYSNSNYYLLGLIVEKVSGVSYPRFVERELFKPLGLTRTRYDSGDTAVADRALGYAFDPATSTRHPADPINMAGPFAAGALASTGGDLIRWQIALTEGRAVSAASFRAMTQSAVKTGQGDAVYGFGLISDTVGGTRRVWHNGGINGFNSVLTWWPDLGLRTAVISNSEGLPSSAVEQMIVASLTSERPLPPPRTSAQPGSDTALRALLAGVTSGHPDYALLAPPLADLMHKQLPMIQSMFQGLGALQSIAFKGVDFGGADQYLARFAKGGMLFSISLDPHGQIGGLLLSPVAPAKAGS
jgi:CubicO group peptidase (beta-lactamase class C family)